MLIIRPLFSVVQFELVVKGLSTEVVMFSNGEFNNSEEKINISIYYFRTFSPPTPSFSIPIAI